MTARRVGEPPYGWLVYKSARWRALFAGVNVLGVVAFAWPFLLPAAVGGRAAHETDATWILLGLVVCLGALLFVQLGRGGMGPKTVALLGVLGATMVALRIPGFVAGFSAMFLPVLLAGNAFGPGFGFLVGATGTFASGLFVGGLGPWLPFQMVAVGWVGAGAGLMPRRGRWPVRIGVLAAYGVATGFLFGAVMNLWSWPYIAGSSAIGWAPQLGAGENLARYLDYYLVTSLSWDSFRAVGNALLVLVAGRAVLGALDRAARRMNLEVGNRRAGGHTYGLEEQAGWPRPQLAAVEESPGSTGQGAGENPRRGDPRPVPQKQTATGSPAARVKR